jgi:hypothetical protein
MPLSHWYIMRERHTLPQTHTPSIPIRTRSRQWLTLHATIFHTCIIPSNTPHAPTYVTIFTSISTPAGRCKFVNALTIFGDGFNTSINRLWTLISYCSRAFLCTKLERFTVYLRISVGSGTGPTTSAPFLTEVSIICLTELSIIFASYARTRIRKRVFISSVCLVAKKERDVRCWVLDTAVHRHGISTRPITLCPISIF